MSTPARVSVPKALPLLLCLSAALAACSGPEERLARAIERGEQFMADEDFEKARVEFSNALQIDPNNAEVIFMAEIGRASCRERV